MESPSELYFKNHKLLEDQMMRDGFFDPGRSGGRGSTLPDLDELRGAGLSAGEREVILLDGQEDDALEEKVKGALEPLNDDRARAKRAGGARRRPDGREPLGHRGAIGG